MDRTCRKRVPLSPLSPGSSQNVQKRRPISVIQKHDSASININAVNFENIDPNIKTQSTILIGNASHSITTEFVGVDLSGCNRAASNSHQKSNINAPQDHSSTKRVNEIILTPSQRSIASNYQNPENPEFSTYIIGALENYEREKLIDTTFGKRNIAKFRITDGRYSHKVTIWGQLALKTDELFLKAEELPIIVIVTSTKLKIFKNSVQISTLPSSKIYLNLDNDVVHSMRLRLEEEGYIAPGNTTSEPLSTLPPPIIQILTLKELGEKSDSNDAKNKQTDIYPSTIKEIVGKKCIFTDEMSDDNLLIHSKIFKVKNARDTNITIPSASQATLASASNSSYADNIIELSNFDGTPGSVKSSTKKIKTCFVTAIVELLDMPIFGDSG
ncbi:hypothetical protein POM88_016902 [Heracleum sosnowskyi]|uniref:Uncharacterized protein n=1 Tax=Heracleum sosnowskyi TaxID=360622 RepID=A0AAD8IPG5_9APIA|nr:hypothetical protein POM88_016902 [Heracleum sosnowskyi]